MMCYGKSEASLMFDKVSLRKPDQGPFNLPASAMLTSVKPLYAVDDGVVYGWHSKKACPKKWLESGNTNLSAIVFPWI